MSSKREISKEFAGACAKGDLPTIRARLREGVNNTDAKGSTPIHIAAYSNKVEAVKLLIARGSNLNVCVACCSSNGTPRCHACATEC